MIATILNLSEDLWSAEPVTTVDISRLQVKDFTKWLRKQAHIYGRKAEIATAYNNAVEIWLKELGLNIGFLIGGELMFEDSSVVVSQWSEIGHYMTDDDSNPVLTIGGWLRIVENQHSDDYLI